jgi:hypothetical protein
VTIDDEGVARIDFAEDFSRIDNVGTTGVTGMVFGELNRTVFQFDTVSAIMYSLGGQSRG